MPPRAGQRAGGTRREGPAAWRSAAGRGTSPQAERERCCAASRLLTRHALCRRLTAGGLCPDSPAGAAARRLPALPERAGGHGIAGISTPALRTECPAVTRLAAAVPVRRYAAHQEARRGPATPASARHAASAATDACKPAEAVEMQRANDRRAGAQERCVCPAALDGARACAVPPGDESGPVSPAAVPLLPAAAAAERIDAAAPCPRPAVEVRCAAVGAGEMREGPEHGGRARVTPCSASALLPPPYTRPSGTTPRADASCAPPAPQFSVRMMACGAPHRQCHKRCLERRACEGEHCRGGRHGAAVRAKRGAMAACREKSASRAHTAEVRGRRQSKAETRAPRSAAAVRTCAAAVPPAPPRPSRFPPPFAPCSHRSSAAPPPSLPH
jgi:hypothetical protein